MVDAVVSYVVERLGDYLIQEAVFLAGVKDEVAWLKKELEWMLCFIKDAEQKQVRDPLIRQWLSDIRDIAYDAEEVLDKYKLHVHDEGTSDSPMVDSSMVDEEETSERRQGFLASMIKCSCIFNKEESNSHKKSGIYSKGKGKTSLYSIGKEIEALKNRLRDVSQRRGSYGLEDITNKMKEENPALEKLKQLRRATSFAVEEKIVGFEDDTNKLLAKLFDKEPRRMVISICGMGGLGKTTLARKLYHHVDVKDKFDYCGWVSVSQDYKPKDILVRIIKSFDFITAIDKLETEEDMERCLHKSLQGYSYLMVVDDVWHNEDWESLKRAFPNNMNGSRVIITTRIKEVTERSDGKNYVHELRFLTPDESWRLFCEKAFRNTNGDHKGLENLGREMVQKCGGLPLAIVVLGGFLSTKKPQEWRMVRDHIWRHLRSDSIQISYLLDLSFNDLSHELKLCFLYLSLFPEDYEIYVEKLIRLLLAEGFISQNKNQITEEVAKENLDALINRSLIQVEKRCWGRVATCKVHDLLRDLAIQKAKELNFIHICDEAKDPSLSSIISSCRRQAVYSQTPSYLWLHHTNSLSHSLLLFNQEWRRSVASRFYDRFSLLRVLDSEFYITTDTRVFGIYGDPLTEDIGKLIHLKYFGLMNSDTIKIPPSIVKLQRLETLDLSNSASFVRLKLPIEIGQLQQLRHLLGNFTGTLPIENLTNLQILKYVEVESWSKVNTDKLVNLRELQIEEGNKTAVKQLFAFDSISKLKSLQFLSVKQSDWKSFASLQPLSHCSYLVDLRLSGNTEKLPENMHAFLPNLECLSLTVPHLEDDPMLTLEKFPSLTILDLHVKSYHVKKMICTAEGFPRLEILQLDADGLREWLVEEGAMPMLRALSIPEIPKLKIPERLRSMPPPAQWECKEYRYLYKRNGFQRNSVSVVLDEVSSLPDPDFKLLSYDKKAATRTLLQANQSTTLPRSDRPSSGAPIHSCRSEYIQSGLWIMVDAVVSYVVQRLGDYLIQEAVFLVEVKNEVIWLKKELDWTLCFIEDAEQKQVRDPLIRQWLSDVRDIAYDTEDVLDKYMLQVNDGGTSDSLIVDEEGTSERRQGFLASITKCSCIFNKEQESNIHKKSSIYGKGKEKISLYSIGKEIEALKNRLRDVSQRRGSYGLEDISNERKEENPALEKLKQLRRATSFAVEDNVVGFEDDTNKLLAKLFDEEPLRMVISICGMGGLGKTTLARKLYHHVEVKDKFDYCGWVSVSQDYKPKDILMRIIKSFDFVTATVKLETEEDMERCIHKSLQGYSYLMVVDDLWHKEDWESLKRAFPNNKNGSRVIITTRIKEVAERSDGKTYVHELRFLTAVESWRLFCEKAFRNTNRGNKVLEKLGREMVQKCGGLPLAIVVLGGFLSTKKPQEWRMVRDHIWRHLRSDSIQISYLLDLSFNYLSRELKLCFLYLSLFPEDYEINVEKLVRLLVAEGFLSQNENQIMEEVAKEKLDELINRSLIQVEKRCWGTVATCKVHDLLRDLAIQKARELNFIHICDETTNPSASSGISSCRRQAVYSETAVLLCLQHANSLSRSLLFFNQEWSYSVFILLFARFSLLRVFDFQAVFNTETRISAKDHVDEGIGNLIHLKYLGLKNSYTTIVPPSIVKLRRLETLDLSGLFQLPTEISELKELRHLIGRFIGTLPIENLTNLQTLKYVELESWSKLNTDKLVNLRELHIEENNQTEGKKLFTFDSLANLKNLRFLSVKRSYSKSFASLQPLSHCSYLIDLRLRGRMKRLPEDMQALLPNLECFSLTVPYLEEDPLLTLEKLLHLTILYLKFNCRYVKKLDCTAEGFPGLEILKLDIEELEEWQVEEGAMPMLRGLRISEIPGLKIPERLRQMPPPALWEFEEQNGHALWFF